MLFYYSGRLSNEKSALCAFIIKIVVMLGFKLLDAETILFFPTLYFIDTDKEKKLQANKLHLFSLHHL